MTDYSLLAISEADLMPGLKTLNLEATEVTDTGITWLAERCTTLLNLTLTRCGNVSYAGVKAIRESWKHVQLVKTEVYFGLKPAHRGQDKRYIDEFGAIWKAATAPRCCLARYAANCCGSRKCSCQVAAWL